MKKLFKTRILLLVAILCCTLQASAYKFEGAGRPTDPFLIKTAADLQELAKDVYNGKTYEGNYFKQTADIVVNENVIKSDGTFNEADKSKFTSWVPAGRVYGFWTKNSFKGVYDGDSCTISGLYFGDGMDEPYVGLFGYVDKASIRNITIRDSYMGCKATGTYNSNYHGFLVGFASNSTITNCHVENSVIDIKTDNGLHCGGLVGEIETSIVSYTMKDCSFSGTINIQTQKDYIYVGGILGGQTRDNYKALRLENCSVDGTLNVNVDYAYSCSGCYVAGLAPSAMRLHMSECVNRMNFNVYSVNFADWPDNQGGGIIGNIGDFGHMKNLRIYQMGGSIGNMTSCVNFGNVKIGDTDYRDDYGEKHTDKKNFIGPIDEFVVTPVGSVSGVMNCAFYGCTNVGRNGYSYHSFEGDYSHEAYQKLFNLKVYTLASSPSSDIYVSRVLRREDGTSIPNEHYDNNPYLIAQTDEFPGIKLYKTTDLADIIKDRDNVINSFSGYDEKDKKTYKWGYIADGPFIGCPAPSVVKLTETNLIGDGTLSNPYLIQDANDYLFAVSYINSMDDSSDKYFKLLADLDMSNSDSIGAIGSEAHPFMGHFNGNGHAITGLNAKDGSMFGVVKGGSVTNLTLLDMTCNEVDQCSPLVNVLADNNGNRGSVSNCYVGGNINVKLNHDGLWAVAPLSGLCGTCRGGQISDSYFKGKFNVSGYDSNCDFAGLCYTIEKGTVNSKISNCYSVFNIAVDDEHDNCILEHVFGVVNDSKTGTLSDDIAELNNVYFMYDGEKLQEVHNGTKVTSYADMNLGSSFIEGIFNPVLPGTKSYKLTNGKGLDAILEDGEGTGDMANTIFHYVPANGEDYQNDKYLWQHPNIAVYNADDNAEYLINCNLDNAKALQLNMNDAKSKTIKANMHYPLSIYHDNSITPQLQLLCLPVTVQRDALPEGCKLRIVGQKTFDKTNNRFLATMVECDSVPAGVPFLLEIPADKTIYDKNATYDVVLRGNVAPEPQSTVKVGDNIIETGLIGTYKTYDKKYRYQEYEDVEIKDGYYEIRRYPYVYTVKPFHAYGSVVRDNDNYSYEYRIFDNLLLDDESNDVTAMLNTYNGKTTGVVLKRTMNSSVWNTVCLPFDLSAAEISQAFGENTKVEKLAKVEKAADGGAVLRFQAVTTGMEAGKTYLVKPSKSGTLYNFADKEIKNELSSEAADSYYNTYFKGTFAPMMLQGTAEQAADGYSYNYFIQSNNLYYLPEGEAVPLKGFRGWILIASNSLFGDGSATAARLIHYDGSTTGVSAIEYGKTADGTRIYNLQGIETGDTTAPGVYIKKGKKYVKK